MPTAETARHATSSVTRKGQVTIPAHIRRFLGIEPRDRMEFVVKGGRVEIIPAGSVVARTAGSLKSNVPPLSPEEERALFEQLVAEDAENLHR